MSAIFRSLALNMQEKKETTEWTKKPNQAPAVDATAGSKKNRALYTGLYS